MLIVVNAIFSMFSFLQVALFIYVQAWRARSRSGASCFPADCADLHRCRSGCFLFSRRSRRFAQMPFGVLLVFPQIAQICTDAVRGGLIPQIAPRRGRCHRCRSGRFLFSTQIAQICRCRSGCFLFSRRSRRFADAVRALLVFPQIAQICTDARSGCLVFHTDCAVGAKEQA